MIAQLADMAYRKAGQMLFCVQRDGRSVTYSYRRTRFAACALARELEKHGYGRGTTLACNLYNGAETVLLALAAAYGGLTLALLNPRLSADERRLRIVELENATGEVGIDVLEKHTLERLMIDATGYDFVEYADLPEGSVPQAEQLEAYARECERDWDAEEAGIVMFTSGSSGTPKATMLPWSCLIGAAKAANEMLMEPGQGVWQCVLPMCHVGGFQIMVRSLLNGSSFIVYEHYSPQRILNDVLSFRVTHISVVDKILADLVENDRDKVLVQYECILLGGAELNEKTLRGALRAKARVYSSYGMTETSSAVAAGLITRNFDGGLQMLPGYEARVVSPDEDGIGQLHLQGPGIFEGYLNARKAMSADGFFVTGDRAAIDREGKLHVFARTEDLIISGGENIYPAEVRDVLLGIPGVRDAYVFGTADETWGYRPVAFIEADFSAKAIAADHEEMGLDPQETGIRPATCSQEFAHMVHEYLEGRMSHLHHPKHVLVMKEFPRTIAGKTDRQALKQSYDKRIDIKSLTMFRVKQPFVQPIKTSKGTLTERESFFVEVEDWAGRTGIAECVSFATDWYLPETLGEDYAVVRDHIAPIVLSERYLHPSEVSASLATFPALAKYPMAKAAVEPAIWDLYGKIVGQPLSQLIGGQPGAVVPGGAVVGIGSVEETLQRVRNVVERGYTRVKLKVQPEGVFETVSAVRSGFPELAIMLDANQSFDESNLDILCKLDTLNLTCIEEPYNPSYVPRSGETNLFVRLSLLQDELKTPVCLDESVVTAKDMEQAMEFDNLSCYALKIAKFGGIQPTLDFYHWLLGQGKQAWMGGMFDTGVSKRMHAAFATLPGMSIQPDVSSYSAYFSHDACVPPLEVKQGKLTVNERTHPAGLGCVLDHEYLHSIAVDEVTITTEG